MSGGRLISALVLLAVSAVAQSSSALHLSGQVAVRHAHSQQGGNADVAVWLVPQQGAAPLPSHPGAFTMEQKQKRFVPDLLIVPVGATVNFPNADPFFHNVFSLGDARPFDLGLYQAGSSRARRFDQPGISYVFCNIHSQMSAVILAVPTPWFAVSDDAGHYSISGVPPGAYVLHLWYERADPAALAKLEQPVQVVAGSDSLPTLTIEETHGPVPHKNKYGQNYDSGLGGYGPSN